MFTTLLFYSQQPLTEVTLTSFYNVKNKLYGMTVNIPYTPDKTGNYTFKTEMRLDSGFHHGNAQRWFYIYFKSDLTT
jgi:hypothetical protein